MQVQKINNKLNYMKAILFFLFTAQIYSQDFSKAIEDNSFFIEEAYNQEEGIIQHILLHHIIFPQKLLSQFLRKSGQCLHKNINSVILCR